MTLFYATQIQFPVTELSEEEAHHALRVLRLRDGENVFVTDGKGKLYGGSFIAMGSRQASVRLKEEPVKELKRTFSIRMAVAPLKSNDRFEWFLEKATELGVTEIIPLIGEHSERLKFNPERWDRVVMAALKQSLNPLKPSLAEPIKFSDFVSSYKGKVFIAHCEERDKTYLPQALGTDLDICICIGPEGDFSSNEISKALSAGFIPVSLGDLRLRTETAALTALVMAVAHYQGE